MQLELFNLEDYKNPPIQLEDVFQAYFDCRKNKRSTYNALAFETNYEENLVMLWKEIVSGKYNPGRSIAFIVTKPVKREVFAADFRDRVVHHLIANKILPLLENRFIDDTYSCRNGKGTMFGVKRIAHFIEECSEHYTRDCYILKLDIKSFFMSMDKNILYKKLAALLDESYNYPDKKLLKELIYKTIFNNPEKNCIIKGKRSDWKDLPHEKSLFFVPKNKGLPIGNLTSQLFANYYLNDFDHFVKNICNAEYYGRYVDDFVVVHTDKKFLLDLIPKIKSYLKDNLLLTLHPKKIYLQHYSKGVKFIGAVAKPDRTYVANRTKGNFYEKLTSFNKLIHEDKNNAINNAEHFVATVNSYLGFMIHYSTYKIRRKLILEKIDPLWRECLIFDDKFAKVRLKNMYKESFKQQMKLRKQRKNRKRNAKKRKKSNVLDFAAKAQLNPFV